MKSINKTLFIKTLECPVYAWHLYRGLVPKDSSLSDDFLVMEAKNIHTMAKMLFKDGVQVCGKLEEALQQTKDLINDKNTKTIFEPVFKYDDFIAKADILSRTETGSWEIIEVKSGNKLKHKYISDIAYVSLIATKTIPSISKATLYLLSKDFRLGKAIDELFTKVDCSFDVFTLAEEYSNKIGHSKEILSAENPEEKKLKISCKNCALFKECTGKDIEYHIFDLPRLSQLVFEKLAENKIYEVKDVPEDTELTQMQKIVKDCVVNDKIFISPNLKTELDKIIFPAYYLDFESVMTIYPLYNNIAPHSQILTQYSIHKCDKTDNITDHFEYIADHTQDCRKIIAKKLIEILGTTGSIITYSSFEKQIIEKLIPICPEFTEQLKAITARIIDLEEILRLNYYDRRFHGRTSIKKVLPVMIPKMNYNELEIGEGGVALSAFAYMAMGLYTEEQIKETKQNLLKYCEQDTLALVKMHKFLYDVANKADNL
jgi:CRISPR/Cas system-associated exonuclease Cas4 (RecB family)